MKICRGKDTGGHTLIVHGEDKCPLCEKTISHRAEKQALKGILFVRKLLLNGQMTLDEYISRTKETSENWYTD